MASNHDELSQEEKEYVKQALESNVAMTEILMVIVCSRLSNGEEYIDVPVLKMQQEFTKIRTGIQQVFRGGL